MPVKRQLANKGRKMEKEVTTKRARVGWEEVKIVGRDERRPGQKRPIRHKRK
jgi:hypothetical protein